MFTLYSLYMDIFFAERTCSAVVRPFRGNGGLAVPALDRFRFDTFFTIRAGSF
jgi:hypothetical protein